MARGIEVIRKKMALRVKKPGHMMYIACLEVKKKYRNRNKASPFWKSSLGSYMQKIKILLFRKQLGKLYEKKLKYYFL